MKKSRFTYNKSGVNIKKADKFVNFISSIIKRSKKSVNFKNIGGFGAISNIPKNLKNPHIVTSTDGVGTKLEIANEIKKFDTIGIDLVAMCVNDLIVQGAKPFLFLDYISVDKIHLSKMKQIIKGIVKGCEISNCSLVGGETAEMPGTYSKGKFDLAGFSVGLVEKEKILVNKIKNNNLILAIPSNGLHSNGYSLVRSILKIKKIKIKRNHYLRKELIKPTKIYVREILKLLDKDLINGCANITGGGIEDNIKRVVPKNLCANVNLSLVKPLQIFKWLKSLGIHSREMIKTFNCGVGFCLIIDRKNLKKVQSMFISKYKPYVIGEISKDKFRVNLSGKINW